MLFLEPNLKNTQNSTGFLLMASYKAFLTLPPKNVNTALQS